MDSIKQTWFEMPIELQISNIGSEVSRAILWKNRGNSERSAAFCRKAIELLYLSIQDSKNAHRKGELSFCIDELTDYFLGENIYETTDVALQKYYDAFI